MKKITALAAMALLAIGAWAEDIRTMVLVPSPEMTCQNCEKKIKQNIRFVKGTKKIETSLDSNTVTITYDADKATLADYEKAFEKIGREVTLQPACCEPEQKTSPCCCGEGKCKK